MPNLANAKKALRQNKVRFKRNQVKRDEVHSLRRKFRKLVEAGKVKEAKELIPLLDKKLDKMVKFGLFKQNKTSRIKARLHAKLKKTASKAVKE